MTKIESAIKKINAGRKPVYWFLSDVENLNSLVPEGKVTNFSADTDSCKFSVDGLGEVGLRVVSKDPENTIKFESEGSVPFRFKLWIQLKDTGNSETAMKLTIAAELNSMMKMVAEKPLKNGLEVIASQLSDHLNKKEDW